MLGLIAPSFLFIALHLNVVVYTKLMENFEPKTEVRETKFNEATEIGISRAFDKVTTRFENSPDEKNNLPYHNRLHSEDVVRRTALILSKIREKLPSIVAERDIGIGKLIAANHDTVQNWQENIVEEGQFTKITRKRFVGTNEKASYEEAQLFMEEINREAGEEIFTDSDKRAVQEGIDGTVPNWDQKEKTVTQLNVTDKVGLTAVAVALSDLGTAGMDGQEGFLSETDRLFREENLDVLDAVKDLSMITDEQKEYFRGRMLSWVQAQIAFIIGRKNLLDSEMKWIPEEARESVKALFDKFDESIEAGKKSFETRSTMSFEEIAKAYGYKI